MGSNPFGAFEHFDESSYAKLKYNPLLLNIFYMGCEWQHKCVGEGQQQQQVTWRLGGSAVAVGHMAAEWQCSGMQA